MVGMKTSSAVELLVELRREDPAPLHQQLERELRAAVRSGRLAEGSAMPSSRALAQQLGLSRGVVVEAYEQLVAEGYLASRPGSATRVADGAVPAWSPEPAAPPREPEIAFRYGRPDVSQFPRGAWLRSIRRVLAEVAERPPELCRRSRDRGAARGDRRLRQPRSRHVRRS